MNEPRQGFLARGGGWVVIQFMLMLAVIVLGIWFRGEGSRLPVKVTGAVLLVVGGGFGVAGSILLGRDLSPFPPPLAGSKLRQHGVYARVRHPLYTGVMLTSLGWALLWQSAVAFGAALVLVLFFHIKACYEERFLRDRFTDYADYARRVPRFLPRLVRGSKAGGMGIKNDS